MPAFIVIKTLKIVHLNVFKRERKRLKAFLLQININIRFNKTQFKLEINKILYTATYLRDNIIK